MRRSFYVLIIGFLLGVLWRSLFAVDLAGVGVLVLCGVVVFGVARIVRYPHALYVVLAVCACVLGIVRTEYAFDHYEQSRVFEDGVQFADAGVVSAEPDLRDGYTVLWVDVPVTDLQRSIRLRVKVPTYPSHTYGDRVHVMGTLTVPRAFVTDAGRVFNYAGFLMKDHVHYELRDAVLKQLDGNEGNPIVSALLSVKHSWLVSVSRLIPEPAASLAGGVIVGAKQSLGEDWLEAFRVTGLIHIVVLSGYNLTLVANAILRMMVRFPRALGFVLGIAGVVLFALMTGAGPTVVRATIMAVIGMLAVHLARPHIVLRALTLAGFCMVLWNPFVLLFDPGFQLSFIATLGLVLGSPIVHSFIPLVPAAFQLREIVAATLSTQIAVLPLLLYHIGLLSVVAPLTNVLVLPFMPFAMLAGFLAGMLGMVSVVLATPVAWVAYALLSYMFAVVEYFARLPFASVELPTVSWWMMSSMYICLYFVWRYYTKHHPETLSGVW